MTSSSQSYEPTLLAVLAHPDDETFGIGGTLALYAQRGVQVHLICATRGEAGSVNETDMQGFDSVAELRVGKELKCAAEQLGLSQIILLGYRDSGMAGTADNQHPEALMQAPEEEVALKIAGHIRTLKPQVIITHDPIGGYKHPDHIAVHKATVQAFQMAGDPAIAMDGLPPYQPQKLYYSTFPKRLLRLLIRVLPLFRINPRQWGRNQDIDLTDLASEGSFPIHAAIDHREVLNAKRQATRCHSSQIDDLQESNLFGYLANYLVGTKEQFMRAFPPADDSLREKDLFEGVR